MTENGSGPLTWSAFVSYMEQFKRDLDNAYPSREACKARHEALKLTEEDVRANTKRIYMAVGIGTAVPVIISLLALGVAAGAVHF